MGGLRGAFFLKSPQIGFCELFRENRIEARRDARDLNLIPLRERFFEEKHLPLKPPLVVRALALKYCQVES